MKDVYHLSITAFQFVCDSEGGMAFLLVNHSKGGMTVVFVSQS